MKNNIQLTAILLWGFLSFFVYSPLSYGQENLVLNPSFEGVHLDSLSCTYYQSNTRFNSAIAHWTNPTTATTDLYHMSLDDICTMYPFDVLNPAAVQPRTGDAMVGLVLYTEELPDTIEPLEYKEYVQGQLREPLIEGVTYLVQFYTMMGKRSVYSINNIGFKFLEEPYFQNNQSTIQLTPDFNYPAVIDLNEKWTLIEFEYTAPTSGLQYFIIGNFFNAHENTIQHRDVYSRDTSAYYVIDDVAVISYAPSFDPIGPYCSNTVFTLPVTSKEGYTGTWTPQINNQETTTYTFIPDHPKSTQTTLTVEIIPPTEDLHFDLETTFCKGTEFSLPLISKEGIKGTWTPAITTQKTTTYTFYPTEENPCYRPFTVKIKILPLPNSSLEYYCKDEELLIQAILPLEDKSTILSWHINDHLIEDTSTVIKLADYTAILPTGTTTVKATLVNENGCTSLVSLALDDIRQYCFIPKGISPNGDGKNDFFDLHTFGGVSLQIFNRYGMKVYEQTNYTNQWEGQSNNGTPLPSGTYFYQFITPLKEHHSGWVEVMR
ncbi:gliding motility-associated C-terminal domain-containing protein [Myroides sp. DW712]|uniref:gliding motility-associated C-terminal domain-containing protein n=1 Tax=Myroides sp. DW712 TaxID=3389800 RepID=UPI00397E8B58